MAKFAMVLPAAGILAATFAPPATAEPATPLRVSNNMDMVAPWYPWDFLWIETQNPHGSEKLLITFTANNLPEPGRMETNVTTAKGEYFNTSDFIKDPYVETNLPSVTNSVIDFRFVADQNAWHLTFDNPMSQVGVPGAVADLWFRNTHPGAAMDPATWDAPETVNWTASIGTADVYGWIQFPNTPGRTKVDKWAGEEERMAGNFSLFPRHIGYDYAQSGNPDGSADQLFIFVNLDGTRRGLLAHTGADGSHQMCEPNEKTSKFSDWKWADPSYDRGVLNEPFVYPRTIEAHCSGPLGTLSYHYTTTEEHLFPVKLGPSNIVLGTSTMSSGYENSHPGSIATIQHNRNPAWAGNQTDWRTVQY